jgi:hypothetical protein
MLNAILFLAEYQHGALLSSGKPISKIGEACSDVQKESIGKIHMVLYPLFRKQLNIHSKSLIKRASGEMSKLSFLGATVMDRAENIRDDVVKSFNNDAKSWIPNGFNWDAEVETQQLRDTLEQMRIMARNSIVVCFFSSLIDIILTGFPSEWRFYKRVWAASFPQLKCEYFPVV